MQPPMATPMGRLRIGQVFISFDGPRLFSCVNESGQRFLGLHVDEDEEAEYFLYSPASTQRLDAVRSGQLPLREAFAEPNDGGAWLVRDPGRASDVSAVWYPSMDLRDEWLPDPNVRLTRTSV